MGQMNVNMYKQHSGIRILHDENECEHEWFWTQIYIMLMISVLVLLDHRERPEVFKDFCLLTVEERVDI